MIFGAVRALAQQVRDAVLFAFTPHAATDAFWGEATRRCRDGARQLADAEAEFEVWPSSENRLLRPLNLEDIADRLDLLSGQVEDVLKLLKPGDKAPVPPLFTLPDRGTGSPGLPVYPETNGSNTNSSDSPLPGCVDESPASVGAGAGHLIDFFDNTKQYTALCCRPGGRCTTGTQTPEMYLSEEDEHKLTEFINRGASMREVIDYWHSLQSAAANDRDPKT